MSTTKLIQLYTALVRSIMDYGGVGHQTYQQTSSRTAQSTRLALGLLPTAGTAVAAVAAGIPPFDLHLTEYAIRVLPKISQPLKDRT